MNIKNILLNILCILAASNSFCSQQDSSSKTDVISLPEHNDLKLAEKIMAQGITTSILITCGLGLSYQLYKKYFSKESRIQEFLSDSLANGEISISIKSLYEILSAQSEYYLGTVEDHSVAIRFFQKNGLDINKLYTTKELSGKEKQNASNNKNFTLLMLFSDYGPIVKACLQCGANPSIKNSQGLTALDIFVNDFMKLKKEISFKISVHFFAFEALLALLKASDQQTRTDFFKNHLPIADLPAQDKSSYITFYTSKMGRYEAEETHTFTSCNFAEAFLYMLPRIPSIDAQELLEFYTDSLSTQEERKAFKIKMQGFLDFITSKDIAHAYIEDNLTSDIHNPKYWVKITSMINNLN